MPERESCMDRRLFLFAFAAPAAALTFTAGKVVARDDRVIRVRRLVRHRIRRRVTVRTIVGRRPFLVVPRQLATGWELVHASQVVVVLGLRWVETDGRRHEVAVVQAGNGPSDEIEILREDTADNGIELSGSALPPRYEMTPALEDSPR